MTVSGGIGGGYNLARIIGTGRSCMGFGDVPLLLIGYAIEKEMDPRLEPKGPCSSCCHTIGLQKYHENRHLRLLLRSDFAY
jgi:hypothetical protein